MLFFFFWNIKLQFHLTNATNKNIKYNSSRWTKDKGRSSWWKYGKKQCWFPEYIFKHIEIFSSALRNFCHFYHIDRSRWKTLTIALIAVKMVHPIYIGVCISCVLVVSFCNNIVISFAIHMSNIIPLESYQKIEKFVRL